MTNIDYLILLSEIELNASVLYYKFSIIYSDDFHFWFYLSLEEKNHSSLIKSAIEFDNLDINIDNFLPDDIDSVILFNKYLNELIITINENQQYLSRTETFETAMLIENSISEKHFQNIMENASNDKLVNIFKKLNGDDKHHYERLLQYYNQLIQST